jgi:proteasome assembly chaperone (PAC2) family protein
MTANKKRLLKWLLLFVLILVITGGFIGYKMYNKPHRNVEAAKGIEVASTQLIADYESNETGANGKYLDKVIAVTGEVSEVAKNQKAETVITLKGTDMGGIICTIEGASGLDISAGKTVTIKGICTGYLTDVVLVRAIVQAK